MIEIKKGKEPRCLSEYRNQLYSSYKGLSKDNRHTIIESLLKEQGYLCAYCMQRTSYEKGATIEHIVPQSVDKSQALDYSNMLAVCNGNEGKGELICDKARGRNSLTVNPLKRNTIQNITYNSDGKIYSDNETVFEDLNDKHKLNLNSESVGLPHNRKSARDTFIKLIRSQKPEGDIKHLVRKYIEIYSGFNSKGQKYEYCGIILDWLYKHNR